MSTYEIPLTSAPQTFLINLAGVDYRMTIRWCPPSECWVLDLATAAEAPVIMGIPLVTGTDLLKQYRYLGIGGQLEVQSLGDPGVVPSFTTLGTDGLLFFIPD